MAVESLVSGVYTSASDVWSFGVTLWEIFSHGKTPFGNLSNQVITLQVLGGARLPKPAYCSKVVHNIMKKCWAARPHDRPDFTQLLKMILELNVVYARGDFEQDLQLSNALATDAQGRLRMMGGVNSQEDLLGDAPATARSAMMNKQKASFNVYDSSSSIRASASSKDDDDNNNNRIASSTTNAAPTKSKPHFSLYEVSNFLGKKKKKQRKTKQQLKI